MRYEMMFIIRPLEHRELEITINKVVGLVNEAGTVIKLDNWGKKRLAYEIQDLNEGLYVLVTFTAEPAAVKELDRVMKITDEVLRHMIIRKGE